MDPEGWKMLFFSYCNIKLFPYNFWCYASISQIALKVLFGDIIPNKTQFYVKLTDKDWASNWKVCSQKDERHCLCFLIVISNYSLMLSDVVLLPNNNESPVCYRLEGIQSEGCMTLLNKRATVADSQYSLWLLYFCIEQLQLLLNNDCLLS